MCKVQQGKAELGNGCISIEIINGVRMGTKSYANQTKYRALERYIRSVLPIIAFYSLVNHVLRLRNTIFSLKWTMAILFILCIFDCFSRASLAVDDLTDKQIKLEQKRYANAEIAIKIIPSANNTFGYDTLVYGKPLVHQPSIPGLSGNEGFSTRKRAQTVAEFVVKKIKNNEMPPTVTMRI